ncbi:MAG: M14 family zinc carboxypeptidase [Promethearchaeota archaeon]
MNKKPFIISFLILLVFSSPTIALGASVSVGHELNLFDSHSQRIPSEIDYTFIWEDYVGAPGLIYGDDALVWGSSFGPYHNYSEQTTKLQSLETAFPDIIDLFSIGKTYFGRDIHCVRITDESVTQTKSEILIVAQHHAREQITVENALYFIDKIVNDSLDPSSGISGLLQRKAIYVIPSLNIDGAELMSQFPWQRKTARPIDEDGDGTADELEASDIDNDGYIECLYQNFGDNSNPDWRVVGYEGIDLDGDGKTGEDLPGGVDPNRNYPFQFGNQSGASADPNSEVYHGIKAFSENCTARLRDFVLQRNFVTAVSLHSGTTAVLAPWAWSNKLPTGEDGERYNTTGYQLQTLTGLSFEYLYPSTGEWGDWMYGRDNSTTKLAFTLETYGNEEAIQGYYNETTSTWHERGIWDMFNPQANLVIYNCHSVYKGLLFLVEYEEPSFTPGFQFWIFIPVIAFFIACTILRKRK